MISLGHYLYSMLSHSLMGLAVAVLVAGCSSNPVEPSPKEVSLEGHWQAEGLEGTSVTVLRNEKGGLLVGTEQGLFRRTESDYTRIGLRKHEVIGVVRLGEDELLVGVKGDGSYFQKVLFKSQIGEESWKPFTNDLGGDEGHSFVNALRSLNSSSDTLFVAGTSAVIARSTDGGVSWELVSGRWDNFAGLGMFIEPDPFRPGRIWAGGVTGMSQPYLMRSTDYGANWEELESIGEVEGTSVESVAYDVVTHPEDPQRVLVGFGGAFTKARHVKRSTDGGDHWQVVLSQTGIHSFARSARYPGVIYASGRDESARPFFALTTDFGDTWEKRTFEEGPSPTTTHDLAVREIGGQEVLFLGTDQGLFSFRFE